MPRYDIVHNEVFTNLFQDISGQVLLDDYGIKVVVIDKKQEEIVQWIK